MASLNSLTIYSNDGLSTLYSNSSWGGGLEQTITITQSGFVDNGVSISVSYGTEIWGWSRTLGASYPDFLVGTNYTREQIVGDLDAVVFYVVEKQTQKFVDQAGAQALINKTKQLVATKQNTLTFDTAPTSSSTNPVTSGGVFTALSSKQNTLTFDSTPTQNSSNPVTSGGVHTALAGKQNTLTFDSTPTQNSSNPITSGGVYSALSGKQNKLTFDTNPKPNSLNPVYSGSLYTLLDAKESKANKTNTISSSNNTLQYPTARAVYNAINELNFQNIATCSFSKHASCVAGNTDYLADRELTIDMGYIKAPQGTLVTLLSFNRTMHYVNDTYLDGSGNYVLYLYINGEQKAAVSNYMGSKKACNMDVITCQFEATGGDDLLSIKLYSGAATHRVMYVSSINAAFAKDVEITQIEH